MIRKLATILAASLAILLVVSPQSAEAKRILFLGDSQSMGAFGKTVDANLRNAGHDVYTYVTGGATPYYWLSIYAPMKCTIGHWEKTPSGERRTRNVTVPKVETLLDRYKPEIVVVQTGVNLYATLRSKRRSHAGNVAEVSRLIENMCKTIANRGAKSYWIAPPHSHPDRYPIALQRELASIMKSVVGKYGVVYESANVTRYVDPYPKYDGIHYGPTEATAWAHKVTSHLVPYAKDKTKKERRGFNPFSIFANKDKKNKRDEPEKIDAPRAVPVAKPVASNTEKPADKPATKKNTNTVDAPDIFIVKKARDADGADDEVTVEIALRKKTVVPSKSDVNYKHALAIYEWDVVRVTSGHYPHKTIRIAHTVYFNGRTTSAIKFPEGKRWSLDLVLLSKYPSVEQWQTFDDLDFDPDLPVYTAKL